MSAISTKHDAQLRHVLKGPECLAVCAVSLAECLNWRALTRLVEVRTNGSGFVKGDPGPIPAEVHAYHALCTLRPCLPLRHGRIAL